MIESKKIKTNQKISIMDNTLREGEQIPGVTLTQPEKLEIMKLLDLVGIDTIELGFPAISEKEFETITKLARVETRAQKNALARTTIDDIDLVCRTGVEGITFFMPVSDILLSTKSVFANKSRPALIEMATRAVDYAKKKNLHVAFGAEDMTRTDSEFIIELYSAIIESGADLVGIVDTVGVLTPIETYNLVVLLKNEINTITITTHLHNDHGMATGNTIAAVEAGVDEIQASVNGFGERAGGPALQEVVMALKFLLKYDLQYINTTHLKELSVKVQELTGITTSPLSPVTGEFAFTHESGLHVSSVVKNSASYEAFPPEWAGMQRKLMIGKGTGKKALSYIFKNELGLKHIDEKPFFMTLDYIKTLERSIDITEAYMYYEKQLAKQS